MIRVFPSLEHSGGACPHSARQFVGLLCSTYLCSRKNITARSRCLSCYLPDFNADSSEFRFARFNIVYEGAQLVLPESPPILRCVGHNALSNQTWKNTESAAKLWLEEIRAFSRRMLQLLSPGIWHAVLPAILFTPEEPCMPPVKTTICFLSSKQDFYDMLFFCIQLFDPLLFDPHGMLPPLPVPVAFHRRRHFLSTLFYTRTFPDLRTGCRISFPQKSALLLHFPAHKTVPA